MIQTFRDGTLAPHRDAVVHTYGSSDGTDAAINYQIVFE